MAGAKLIKLIVGFVFGALIATMFEIFLFPSMTGFGLVLTKGAFIFIMGIVVGLAAMI